MRIQTNRHLKTQAIERGTDMDINKKDLAAAADEILQRHAGEAADRGAGAAGICGQCEP